MKALLCAMFVLGNTLLSYELVELEMKTLKIVILCILPLVLFTDIVRTEHKSFKNNNFITFLFSTRTRAGRA